jgi:hypothetical protein
MATCDAKYRFTYVDIGARGRHSDGGIFRMTSLYQKLEEGTLGIPDPKEITKEGPLFPYFFIGDEAFPLTR